MSTPSKVGLGFEREIIALPLNALLPIREIKGHDHSFGKYAAILSSIREIGLVEPLVVYPNKADKGTWLLLDGHMRLKALKELKKETALCLVSRQDDPFTYNEKVNTLSLIQEHRMIMKALEGGATEAEIAKALNIDVQKVIKGKGLLEGIHPEAIQILKSKPISDRALRVFKRVCALRQIEMANLMVAGNKYAFTYARAMFLGTPQSQLAKSEKPKRVKGMSAEELSRMEKESETLARDFRIFKEAYGENTLHLTGIRRYVRKLLGNSKVKRFLDLRHPELGEELQELATMESL